MNFLPDPTRPVPVKKCTRPEPRHTHLPTRHFRLKGYKLIKLLHLSISCWTCWLYRSSTLDVLDVSMVLSCFRVIYRVFVIELAVFGQLGLLVNSEFGSFRCRFVVGDSTFARCQRRLFIVFRRLLVETLTMSFLHSLEMEYRSLHILLHDLGLFDVSV